MKYVIASMLGVGRQFFMCVCVCVLRGQFLLSILPSLCVCLSVCVDILDGRDLQQACSAQDVGHAAVANRQRGRVGEVQQGRQRLGPDEVESVDALVVGGQTGGE